MQLQDNLMYSFLRKKFANSGSVNHDTWYTGKDDGGNPVDVFKIGTYWGDEVCINPNIWTDHWIGFYDNFFLGYGVCGDGNLEHTTGTTGYKNFAIGSWALRRITTGLGNMAIGSQSLNFMNHGEYNVMVGYQSGALSGLGDPKRNTGVGNEVLLHMNTGSSDNSAFGYYALMGTAGKKDGNSAFGSNAGQTVFGDNNCFFGFNSAGLITPQKNISGSVFMGAYSGYYETESDRLYITNQSGSDEDDGRARAIIYGVMDTTTADQELNFNAQTFFNYDMIIENETWFKATNDAGDGTVNIFKVGGHTMTTNEIWLNPHIFTDKWLESADNFFLGYGVCNAGNLSHTTGTEGYKNFFIGYQAGNEITLATSCMGIGSQALKMMEDGEYNVLIGYQSGMSSTDNPKRNTGVGNEVLVCMHDGSDDNSAFGYYSLAYGDGQKLRNSAFGSWALTYVVGDNNCAFGYSSGITGTTNDGCIFIGAYSGYYETASNRLHISNQQGSSESDARDKAIIYGIMDSTTSDQELYLNAQLFLQYDTVIADTKSLMTGIAADDLLKLQAYNTNDASRVSALEIKNNAIASGTALLGFFGAAPVKQQEKADHNDWAAVSDVVAALVNLGLLDQT